MELEQWLVTAARGLGLDDLALDADSVQTVLDVARDAAHEIERVAAPLTTFLVGVAVGRGTSLAEAANLVTALALQAPTSSADPPGDAG